MMSTAVDAVRAQSRFFYVGMAVTCALIAFIGFTPTYWAPMARGTLDEAPIIHLHGLLFSAWTLFFIVQTTLVAGGRIVNHRALGLLGISLATAMLFVGLTTAIHSLATFIDAGYEERAIAFTIVPMTTIVFFACTVAVAVANVRRPEVHKRLMVLATVVIMMAAMARIVRMLLSPAADAGPPPVEVSIVPAIATDLLVVVAMVHDWRSRRRPHPVYLIGGGLWLLVQLGRIPFSHTPQWRAVAEWLLGFAH
jgi:hypothetical protein